MTRPPSAFRPRSSAPRPRRADGSLRPGVAGAAGWIGLLAALLVAFHPLAHAFEIGGHSHRSAIHSGSDCHAHRSGADHPSPADSEAASDPDSSAPVPGLPGDHPPASGAPGDDPLCALCRLHSEVAPSFAPSAPPVPIDRAAPPVVAAFDVVPAAAHARPPAPRGPPA